MAGIVSAKEMSEVLAVVGATVSGRTQSCGGHAAFILKICLDRRLRAPGRDRLQSRGLFALGFSPCLPSISAACRPAVRRVLDDRWSRHRRRGDPSRRQSMHCAYARCRRDPGNRQPSAHLPDFLATRFAHHPPPVIQVGEIAHDFPSTLERYCPGRNIASIQLSDLRAPGCSGAP